MKIIVAHVGTQHSYRTAGALLNSSMLDCFITTVYDKPFSLTRIVKNLLIGTQKKKAAGRRSADLSDDRVVIFFEIFGLLSLFGARFKLFRTLFPNYDQWLHDRFGERVAKLAIKRCVDAVVMYDTGANSCFRYLKNNAPHIKRILDVTIGNRLYTKSVFEADTKFSDSLAMIEQGYCIKDKYCERLQEELSLSQLFLAGSTFVKKSLTYSNIPEADIKVIPYGVDLSKFECKEYKQTTDGPLKLIFIGSCCYRKGIHHLLAILKTYSNKDVELYIAGGYNQNSPLYSDYKDVTNIHFLGFVTRDVLQNHISECDVFVLPSLAEGLALVTLEALACGLPVICTTNTGTNDIITDGDNGFIVEPSDREALRLKIEWLRSNMGEIPRMGKSAHLLAQGYSWDKYSENLISVINNI